MVELAAFAKVYQNPADYFVILDLSGASLEGLYGVGIEPQKTENLSDAGTRKAEPSGEIRRFSELASLRYFRQF